MDHLYNSLTHTQPELTTEKTPPCCAPSEPTEGLLFHSATATDSVDALPVTSSSLVRAAPPSTAAPPVVADLLIVDTQQTTCAAP
jgi:hypothetical protein